MWMGWVKQDCGPDMIVPLTINFLPSWWYGQYGISHGERIFRDPDFRRLVTAQRHLFDVLGLNAPVVCRHAKQLIKWKVDIGVVNQKDLCLQIDILIRK